MTNQEREHYEKDFKPAYAALMKVYPFTTKNLDGEEWRQVPDFETYQVSNYGRVKRLYKNVPPKVLKPELARNGRLRVSLNGSIKKKHFLINRLVALLFIPNIGALPEVDHIDGHLLNNCVTNLRWVTSSENSRYAVEMGSKKSGAGHYKACLTNEQARAIRDNAENLNTYELAEKFGIDQTTVSNVQIGKSYKNAGGTVRVAQKRTVISEDVKAQIRAEYKRGVRGCGGRVLAKKFGVAPITIRNIASKG